MVSMLLAKPDLRALMRERALAMGKPDAATAIAKRVVARLRED